MANLLLGVTGSVAAIKTPELYAQLRRLGHAVKVIATRPSLYFFDPAELDGLSGPKRRNPDVVVLDEDEWPGLGSDRRWKREDPVLHIELRRWADLLLIAPLDANTLGKLALGLADNCLTCVWRAWEPGRGIVLAPAMNTLMWQHPATGRHLRQLAQDFGAAAPADLTAADLPDWINQHCPHLRIVPPIAKMLACKDIGVGAMALIDQIAQGVEGLIEPDL